MSVQLDIYNRILAGETASFRLEPRALWKLSGPDATRYLNGQVTNDVALLAGGQSLYAAVCTAKGRMEGDVTIARHGEDYYLDADVDLREGLGLRLEKYLIADDASFEDFSDAWSLTHVFGAAAPSAPANGFVIAHARYGLAGHDVWAPAENPPAITPAAKGEDIETLRLEHGIPRWGAELNATTLPPEAGPHMLAAISYTKGCYVGQETIARLKSVGHVNRTLVFLRSSTERFPAPGARLTLDVREAGTITSSAFSPRLNLGIALAYVPRQIAQSAAPLQADGVELTVTPSLAPGSKP